jgi:Kef-type K+ transport system membrane component KefB
MDWLFHPQPHTEVVGPTLTAFVLLDVLLILVLARFLGALMTRISQPRVVGEILAGVLLGPTVLGADLSNWLAPLEARPVLSAIATIALVMFMFLAGVEYDTRVLKGRTHQAGILASLSVAVPALVGFGVARMMHTSTYAGPQGQDFVPFAMFVGAALSVTAFPVMAHMLMERGELNSRMGGLAVATTGIMSVLMFTYIALAAAVASSSGLANLGLKIAMTLVGAVASWFGVRPLLGRLLSKQVVDGSITANGMGIVFVGLVLYGLIADRIGINALVGGFAWGMMIPQQLAIRQSISAKIKDVAMVFLLPVFFSISGFATDLKLITRDAVPALLLFLWAAIASKFLAVVPARSFGLSWKETGRLGALMNTRGLLVLVVGLIGLTQEIITMATFTIIVVVALVTNFMTLPLLNLLSGAEEASAAKHGLVDGARA